MKTLYISTISNSDLLQTFANNNNAVFFNTDNHLLNQVEQNFSNTEKIFVQTQSKNVLNIIEIAKKNKAKIVAVCNSRNKISLKKGIHQVIFINKNCNIVDTQSRLLIATTNAGKVSIYKDVCKKINILVCSLADIKISEIPEENGVDEIENAKIKAMFYHKQTELPVLANDSGLYIDKLSSENQPGQFVRRHNGKELTDKQLLDCYIKMIEDVGGQSDAHYNVGLCVIDKKGKIHTKQFQPKRYFISTPSKKMQKGVPLNSIAYDPESKKYMSEMTAKQKNTYEGPAMLAQQQFIKQCFEK